MRGIGRLVGVVGMGAAAACVLPEPNPGGQIGEEGGAECRPVGRTALGRDEVSPLGFAASEVLAYAVGDFADVLTYADATSTPLAVTITEVGPIELLDMEVVVTGTGEGPAIEPWCSDLVSIGVTVAFGTEDGVFAEGFDVALLASSADVASFVRDLDEVSGTFDPWDHVPDGSDYDEVRAWLDLQVSASGVAGGVHGQGSGIEGDPNDPNSVAYAENIDIATFGAPTE